MQLISSPAKAWEEIRLEEDERKVLSAFVYPMIGLCALAVFLGVLFSHGWSGPESFQIAMTKCCVLAVSLFGGYFLAAYAINEVGNRFFGLEHNLPIIYQLAGYSLVVTFLTNIVVGLFPSFALLGLLFQFYIVYIVWVGTGALLQVKEESKLSFTIISSLLLVVCPTLIQFIFDKLLVILN
ncbi:YIP1 family protein [Bacteroides sp. OttesenSCG-928-D19]|nr:YIP1 family protein [Bacteroides sp. OttesenSCG-928-D19]